MSWPRIAALALTHFCLIAIYSQHENACRQCLFYMKKMYRLRKHYFLAEVIFSDNWNYILYAVASHSGSPKICFLAVRSNSSRGETNQFRQLPSLHTPGSRAYVHVLGCFKSLKMELTTCARELFGGGEEGQASM